MSVTLPGGHPMLFLLEDPFSKLESQVSLELLCESDLPVHDSVLEK